MLDAQAQAWTRNDLDGFLDDYASDATYVGSSGLIEGRERIRASYVRGYWSTGVAEDGLRFRDLAVRTVGPETAVAVGRYVLFDRRTGATTATGVFSLTLRKMAGEWKIVHDHSSADAPD